MPLLTALLLPIVARKRYAWAWTLVTLAAAFSCAGCVRLLMQVVDRGPIRYAMGAWPSPSGIEYVVDHLNAIVLVMISAITLLSAIWMRRGLRGEIAATARPGFLAVFLLCATGMMGIAITGDVFNLYVFLEITSITSYVLVGMGKKRQALYAGYSYLIVGSLGATFILLGIGHLYMATGSLSIADLADRLPALYDSSTVRTSYAFFTVGLAIKMALFPLHGWQPGAYTHAPAASSLFIAATSTKLSAYAFYRVTFDVFGDEFVVSILPDVRDGILVLAVGAIVVGPLLALKQSNMKRLLAYSSVGQIGYIMIGVVLHNTSGVTGGVVHFWNHAASKGSLFCVAGALVYLTGSPKLKDLAGLGKRAPWMATALTIGGCSLVGVPLTGGFLTKFHLGSGALDAGRGYILPFIVISSLLTAIYVWKMVQLVWFTPVDDDTPTQFQGRVPWSMRIPALILAAACIALGVTSTNVEIATSAAEALLR